MEKIELRTFDELPRDATPLKTLLIVDDDSIWRTLVKDLILQSWPEGDVCVLSCDGIPSALQILSTQVIHAVVLDKNLGDQENNPLQNGVLSIPRLLELQEHLQIVMATSSDEIQDVVTAMRNGACGYIVKHRDGELFIETVKRALRDGIRTFKQKTEIERDHAPSTGFELCGKSPAVQFLSASINEMAKADATALITGETGAGKTVAVRRLHQLRGVFLKKPNRPFIQLNMAAIPEALAENELFGHDPGAYTDAKRVKPGAFEQANGGTLFLDEIGEASLALQAKLLTVLDRGVFRRVGGSEDIQSKFRLICATNRDLEELVREKKFREDLYRRISVIEIRVPSLIERKEDIPEIARAVLPKCIGDTGISVSYEDIPEDFIQHLAKYPPGGNIRGIEQQISRLLLFSRKDKRGRPILNEWRTIQGLKNAQKPNAQADDAIGVDQFLSNAFEAVSDPEFPGVLPFIEKVERKIYEGALNAVGKEHGSNKKIAKMLDVSEQVVGQKLKKFGFGKTIHSFQSANEGIREIEV